jgi:hypothetical protein
VRSERRKSREVFPKNLSTRKSCNCNNKELSPIVRELGVINNSIPQLTHMRNTMAWQKILPIIIAR